jgi:hypothetical protein
MTMLIKPSFSTRMMALTCVTPGSHDRRAQIAQI